MFVHLYCVFKDHLKVWDFGLPNQRILANLFCQKLEESIDSTLEVVGDSLSALAIDSFIQFELHNLGYFSKNLWSKHFNVI